MREEMPLVSIVITNYNYAQYLREAIESALAQTYQNTEIILIDDGSTDDSRKVYSEYSKKIRIIEHEKNRGIVYTRNEALGIVLGKYIIFLDADDYFDADYIAKMVDNSRRSGVDVVYPNWRLFGENIDTHEQNFAKNFSTRDLMLQKIHISSSSLTKVSATRSHKFRAESVAEDWDFFMGMALDGKKFTGADVWLNYRQKAGSRGSRDGELEDVKIFLEILADWRKQYVKEVVGDAEFLFAKLEVAVKVREGFAKNNMELREQNKNLRERLEMTEKDFAKTRIEISGILNSRSYKIGEFFNKMAKFSLKNARKQGGKK